MGMILHCGAEPVERDAIAGIETPEATATWTPVPHERLVRMAEQHLVQCGATITDSTFAITKGGARMFGVITLGGGTDYQTVVGIRNSHDQSFPVGLCLGSRVFVCDNLAFSAEVQIKTKHTRLVLDRLPRLVGEGISRLIEKRGNQDRRIEAYKQATVERDADLHDLVIRSYRAGAIPARAITEVIEEFETPRHEEFRPRTVWSYFNACTEILETYGDLTKRTQRLHTVVDAEVASNLLAV